MGLFKELLEMLGFGDEMEGENRPNLSIDEIRGEITNFIQKSESYVRTAQSYSSSYKCSKNSTTAKMAVDYYDHSLSMLDKCLWFYKKHKPEQGALFVQGGRCYFTSDCYGNKPVDQYVYDKKITLQSERYRASMDYQNSLNSSQKSM